jgi:threonine dehydrogenase-like Zn-dependent dehydrogenase
MKASSICGSDIRAIYREHLSSGRDAYRGVLAGHEPCGQVVAIGAGCRRLSVGDRVVVNHIAGCGVCEECRYGHMIGCTSPFRAAHGWQRDGGHAEFLLAEEATCVRLPDELSYVDGALTNTPPAPISRWRDGCDENPHPSTCPSRLMTSPAQPTARGQR